MLDVRRVGRALERPVQRRSGETRGIIVEFDDLCWDAAASVNDLRDPDGIHALYGVVWGDTGQVPPAEVRCVLWRQTVEQFCWHVDVLR